MLKLSLLCFLMVTTQVLQAQNNAANRIKAFNVDEQVAIDGYDPVAYFTVHKAVKGKADLSTNYNGIVYHFSTKENKNIFLKSPSSYEPQYGGWCAYAMGHSGEKVEVDPETFKITDNKLYLFYNAYFNNTLKSWNKDEVNLKNNADNNWKKFFK